MIKNGTRLASQVCDTQVIVVRSADSLDDLRCGGAPMVALIIAPGPALNLAPNANQLAAGCAARSMD